MSAIFPGFFQSGAARLLSTVVVGRRSTCSCLLAFCLLPLQTLWAAAPQLNELSTVGDGDVSSSPLSANDSRADQPMRVYQSGAEVAYSIRGDSDANEQAVLFSLQRQYKQLTQNSVHDSSTGLVWQAEDDGVMRTWVDAQRYCTSLELDGANSWRLPDRAELISLVDYTRVKPSIDTGYFRNTKKFNYWAITEYTGTDEHAWTVLFAEGNVYCFRKILQSYSRCVRNVDA